MWHVMSKDEVLKRLKTNEKTGLLNNEVRKRQENFGFNKLDEKKRESIFIRFLKQFKDFMIIILLIAAAVSAGISIIENNNEYVDSIIILFIVVFNAGLGVMQESKAEKALETLKKLTSPTSKVKRNENIITIPSEEIVQGDIIILEAGNYIPADCRLINAYNLKVEESALTGETVPVLKNSDVILKQDMVVGDMVNLCFATTVIVAGHGEAVVTEIGMNTKVGKIAGMIINDETPETPIQKKLKEVGKVLGISVICMCIITFLIGILKQISIKEMFMTSIGLAVAAIPEGLPAIVTIMLSIGVTKMVKKNAIIRRLPAVETLGSSSVICSDKTGTLTQNKMKVVETYSNNTKFLLELGTMCNDSNIISLDNVEGDPTETAIVNESLKMGINKNKLYLEMPRINEIPFDSTRKLMTTIHKIENKYRIITKGAPDVLLRKCAKFLQHGQVTDIYLKEREITEYNIKMANNSLRVLGVAYIDVDALPTKMDSEIIENNLTFVGLIGMVDPPREGVKEAVLTCKNAGIKTVMITGDHIITAKAIALELGIYKEKDKAITGLELDKITDVELKKDIYNYSVFARVSPEHKVRIVKAYQSTGSVVAMTGDGVNDAPALKCADIGIAMGKAGTDVAKSAADMVLVDDNFVTIVEAVKEGRNIFENIKKAVHFLIATNVGEIVLILLGLILGFKSPLIAIQLLWINLVTDSLPAIALGLEPQDKNIMNKKPRNSKKGIFSDGLWNKIIVEGIMIGVVTLFAFNLGTKMYGIEIGRTMAFVCLGLSELVHSFNIKSDESILNRNLFNNKFLLGAFLLGTILQVGVVVIPEISSMFRVVSLNIIQWIYVVLISFLPIIIIELQKKLNDFVYGKRIYSQNNSIYIRKTEEKGAN